MARFLHCEGALHRAGANAHVVSGKVTGRAGVYGEHCRKGYDASIFSSSSCFSSHSSSQVPSRFVHST